MEDRISARFLGNIIGMSAKAIYAIWQQLGLVTPDKCGGWDLTDLGKSIGGRLSKSNYPVPTFDYEVIKKMTKDFTAKHGK